MSHNKYSCLLYLLLLTITVSTCHLDLLDPIKNGLLADFSYSTSDDSSFAPNNIIFSNLSTEAVSYIWDFGDGSPITDEFNPTHLYLKPGDYTVSLTATNEEGQTDQISLPISLTSRTFNINYNQIDSTEFFDAKSIYIEDDSSYILVGESYINGGTRGLTLKINLDGEDPNLTSAGFFSAPEFTRNSLNYVLFLEDGFIDFPVSIYQVNGEGIFISTYFPPDVFASAYEENFGTLTGIASDVANNTYVAGRTRFKSNFIKLQESRDPNLTTSLDDFYVHDLSRRNDGLPGFSSVTVGDAESAPDSWISINLFLYNENLEAPERINLAQFAPDPDYEPNLGVSRTPSWQLVCSESNYSVFGHLFDGITVLSPDGTFLRLEYDYIVDEAIETEDGGFLLLCHEFQLPFTANNNRKGLVLKLDQNYDLEWESFFDEVAHWYIGRSVVQTPDCGYLVSFWRENVTFIEGSTQLYKLDQNGNY